MRRNRIGLLVVALGGMLTISTIAQSSIADTITPSITGRVTQRDQPFGGEFRFASKPTFAKTCSLIVVLTSFAHLSESADFSVHEGEVSAMSVSPDTARWEAPIDSGATKTFYFTFTPDLVGSHHFALEQKVAGKWVMLAGLKIDINEDGKVICAGSDESCLNSLVPPHPLRTDVPILVEFPINKLVKDRMQDRHFSSKFWITPGQGFKDSVRVDFALECWVGFYTKVQFLLEHTTNIAVSKMPDSWGDEAGPTPKYRLRKGRFAFLPLKPGLTQLTFKVIGKQPTALDGDRISTDYSIYLVIGDDGKFLFAGDFDPYTRFKQVNDPMLGTLKELMAVTNREFQTRLELSRPDYRGQEIDARDGTDSTKADSLHK